MSKVRYNQVLRAEIEELAASYFDLTEVDRASLGHWINAQLLLANRPILPLTVRVLGTPPGEDFWNEVAIRDTIARAWNKPDEPIQIVIRGQIS